MSANVKNYIEQAGIGKENKYHFNGLVYFTGTGITWDSLPISAIQTKNALLSTRVNVYNTNSAIPIAGIALIAGGTGLASMTLDAPEVGCLVQIKVYSITSGDVVVTLPSGVTFDGTNNTATFNAVDDELLLGYDTVTQWRIVTNVSVVLSSV